VRTAGFAVCDAKYSPVEDTPLQLQDFQTDFRIRVVQHLLHHVIYVVP
jgi:hypothetical protein